MFTSFQFILVGVFFFATVVGYLIIKNVPGLLHTPLMSGMNALSGICITGALVATASAFALQPWVAAIFGTVAISLATINVVGGFLVTDKMLNMISKGGNKKLYKEIALISFIIIACTLMIVLGEIYGKAIATTLNYVTSALLAAGILAGIHYMSKVDKSLLGNRFSAICMLLALILTFVFYGLFPIWVLYIGLFAGCIIGVIIGLKVKMIQMPQLVALLNGLGGGASAIIGIFAILGFSGGSNLFGDLTAAIALSIGTLTLIGSLVAAGKLSRILPQKSVVFKGHKLMVLLSLLLALISVVLYFAIPIPVVKTICLIGIIFFSAAFGFLFSIRVGGADMPVTISLLNSLSGVAAGIAGFAVGDILLVAVGGIVGASGLWLTQIMCKSMNRKMLEILMGNKSHHPHPVKVGEEEQKVEEEDIESDNLDMEESADQKDPLDILKEAKDVIIVPGYGMAIAQAQHLVKELAEFLKDNGATIKYAVHPVAGRMPGHMNVLLCEADVDYEDLYEMDDINPQFENADVTIVVGANDVLNPAARKAEGTPIYGMPILNVDKCKNIYIFNFDLKPGYAGVNNPIYTKKTGVHLYLGNAKDTLSQLLTALKPK